MGRLKHADRDTVCDPLQALSKEGDAGLLPTVMEAYARPTRIVRGKDVAPEWMVHEGRFEMDEEHALWAAFKSTRKAVHPAMGIREFLEAINPLRSITAWPGATRSARSNSAALAIGPDASHRLPACSRALHPDIFMHTRPNRDLFGCEQSG